MPLLEKNTKRQIIQMQQKKIGLPAYVWTYFSLPTEMP